MKILTVFAIAACTWAQSGVNRPQLGKMVDPNGAVRTVYGIASSVTLGDVETAGVLSSGCSNTLCLAKTDAGIVSASGIAAAPSGPALFAFDGNYAWVWFSESRQLAERSNGALTILESSVDGEVLSIGANAGLVQFVVRRLTGIWVINQDGSVAGALPRTARAVMLIPGGAVYATSAGIAIHDREIPLEGVTEFSWMSGSYLEVRAGGSLYALRIDPGRETLFQLPGVGQ